MTVNHKYVRQGLKDCVSRLSGRSFTIRRKESLYMLLLGPGSCLDDLRWFVSTESHL